MSAIIYLLTNTVNGKQYVGQTTQRLSRRWSNHCMAARRGSPQRLYCAMRKYGTEMFTCEILEDLGESTNEHLNEREIYWITEKKTFGTGYNMTEGGGGHKGVSGEKHFLYGKIGIDSPNYGQIRTPETCARISAAISGNKNGWYGKSRSGEYKQYMSQKMIGRKKSENHIVRLKQAFGHPITIDGKMFYSKNDAALYLCQTYRFSRNTALRRIASGIVDFSSFIGKYKNDTPYTGRQLEKWHEMNNG